MRSTIVSLMNFGFAVATISTLAATEIDTNKLVAAAKILKRDGAPAAGEPYVVYEYAKDKPRAEFSRGIVPDDGIIRIEDLSGGEDAPVYMIRVTSDEIQVGKFQLSNGAPSDMLELMLPPANGDFAPDLEFKDLFTGEKMRLADFKGQVILLDFWASWCGPCQKPMAENQEAMIEHADDWRDRAVIVALSIDDAIVDAQNHVKQKGWTGIRNVFPTSKVLGWDSDPPEIYGVHSIPTAFLINGDGRIEWRGNPNDVKVAREIDKLLRK